MSISSSRYLENLEKVLQVYKQGDCELVEGNFYCSVCGNKTSGTMLAFEFSNPKSTRTEFYHAECLDALQNSDARQRFFSRTREKIRRVAGKLSARNN